MHITFYNSTEEMLEDLSQAMQAADERVQEWQKAIKKGDYFLFFRYFLPSQEPERDWQRTEYGFNIYGEVLEDDYEGELQHYRFCRCYSSACPEGEIGDIHLSIISGILTKKEFDWKIQALR